MLNFQHICDTNICGGTEVQVVSLCACVFVCGRGRRGYYGSGVSDRIVGVLLLELRSCCCCCFKAFPSVCPREPPSQLIYCWSVAGTIIMRRTRVWHTHANTHARMHSHTNAPYQQHCGGVRMHFQGGVWVCARADAAGPSSNYTCADPPHRDPQSHCFRSHAESPPSQQWDLW